MSEKEITRLCVFMPENDGNKNGRKYQIYFVKAFGNFFFDGRRLEIRSVFQRHAALVRKTLEEFKPDVFHITGLNDVSIIGAYLAWKMNIPLVGSWHTNLHEFAARRLRKKFGFLPEKQKWKFTEFIENKILDGAKLYYKMPQILLAPNKELCAMLEKGTGRPARLMTRGVDTETFSPKKRTVTDGVFRFGYVGRLQVEKNVRLLAEIEKSLLDAGREKFQIPDRRRRRRAQMAWKKICKPPN